MKRRRWLAPVLVVLVAVLLACLETSGRSLYRALDHRDASWWAGARDVFPVWLTFVLVVPFAAWTARRFPIDAGNWMLRVPIHLVAGFIFCIAHLVLDILAQWAVNGRQPDDFLRSLASLFGYYVAIETFVYWGVAGSFMLVQREREMREREVVAARLEASLREARLTALRAQLHPHFLFNTLNAISVLAMKGENQQVVEAIGHLSKLLRATLERDLPQTIPLARELDVLERYLDIQRLRFSDRLQVTCELEPGTEIALVPALLLQPLVENAIHHGLSAAGTGRVDIRAARSGDSLVIEVQDDGAGFEREEVRSNGVGLANTRDRLAQLYGEGQAMECESPVGGGARVRIRLPFASAPSDAGSDT